jgi:hypothetical protein
LLESESDEEGRKLTSPVKRNKIEEQSEKNETEQRKE